MVVPQPVRIQHGDAAQLGMLAYLAGRAQQPRGGAPRYVRPDLNAPNTAFERATAAPQPDQARGARVAYGGQGGLDAAVQGNRVTVNPDRARSELEAVKQQQGQRRAQTPTGGPRRAQGTPLVQDLQQRPRGGTGVIQGEGGVSVIGPSGGRLNAPDILAAQQMAGVEGTDPAFGETLSSFQEAHAQGGGFTQGRASDQGLSTQAQTKLAYAQLSGLDQLPQQQQQAVQQIILDEGVDPQQARLMMDRVAERMGGGDATGLSPRQAAQMQVHELRREEERAREQAEEIGQQFSAEQRAMSPEEFRQEVEGRVGEDLSWRPMYRGEGAMTEDRAAQLMADFGRYKQLENQTTGLQQERRRRIGLDGGGGTQTGPQPGDVEDGYEFQGGDPGDPQNWKAVR